MLLMLRFLAKGPRISDIHVFARGSGDRLMILRCLILMMTLGQVKGSSQISPANTDPGPRQRLGL